MHVVEARNLTGQVMLEEIVPESSVELFVTVPPVDEGLSKVLASHFVLCIPLVAQLATGIPMLIEKSVRPALHRIVGERRGSTPAVDVDGFARFGDSETFPSGAWPQDAAANTHKQAGRQRTSLTRASSCSGHVTKRFNILATLKQGNEGMYSNASGYVHMGLRLHWGKCITGQ